MIDVGSIPNRVRLSKSYLHPDLRSEINWNLISIYITTEKSLVLKLTKNKSYKI